MPKDYSNIHEMSTDDAEESARLSLGQLSNKPDNASAQDEDS
jgi:hypothetical protein